jgi:O-antigen ligase
MALFALVQGISSNGKLYWVRTPAHGGWIYGPYVNHDHYAGLMEMLAPIPLVFALTRYAHGPGKTMAAVAAALMASSIFLSGSRGGMAAFAIQMAILAVLASKKQKPGRTALAAGIFLAVVVGLLAWLGGGELANRMASIQAEARAELSGGTRVAIDRDALKMFAHRPILGWGLGVFPTVYPQFRTFYTNFFVNAAHNDYLQLLVEMGALGFAIMLWFIVVVYSRAIKKLGYWPSDTNGAVTLAAVLGVTGILVHSLVDFNLQIPANAALFYVLCTVATMEPHFGTTRRTLRSRSSVSETSSAQ